MCTHTLLLARLCGLSSVAVCIVSTQLLWQTYVSTAAADADADACNLRCASLEIVCKEAAIGIVATGDNSCASVCGNTALLVQ
jgi:hypothetical protein